MNRGAFQSSLVQQMMGGSPSWWNMNNLRLHPGQNSPLLTTSSSSSSSSSLFPQYPQPSHPPPIPPWHDNQDLPESWSQLLLGGLVGEEDRYSFSPFQAKKMENWDQEQVVYSSASDVKQEASESGHVYCHGNEEIQEARSPWGQILPAVSSHRSSVTTSFSCNMLDFSNSKLAEKRNHQPDHSYECNSTAPSAAFKKARVQASSPTQSTVKVRKEKLGDRITALHQIVSPFGKTDTASVLLEAIGYIRFLQSQIEALSSPYLGSGSGSMRQPAQGERSCIFPEDPGQLLNDSSIKKRGASDQGADDEPRRDLRSRGLCLVPVSCTLHVGSDNGADYWAPTLGGGF